MSTFLPRVTLVLGGAGSGKSRFAEQLVKCSGLPRTYIATAQAFDPEMERKIQRHIENRGEGWTTIEEPLDVPHTLNTLPAGSATLLDCTTLWLSNSLLADRDLELQCTDLLSAVAQNDGPLVIVSNEVGQGIVPDTAMGRKFRNAQGNLNQELAAYADLVVLVVAGLPMVLKGRLPRSLS